jgi:hypothetical protein
MTSASYARHETVVAGLLREQMELVKNIRDTNLKNYIAWDTVFIENIATSSWTGWVYVIENDFWSGWLEFNDGIDADPGSLKKSPVYLKNITTEFWLAWDDVERFTKSQLFLDTQERYTHIQTDAPTPYASYIIVSPLGYTWTTGDFTPVKKDWKHQGYIIDARVIVKNWNNYREYDAKTAITDWVK